MHLSFLKNHFPHYEVELYKKDDSEWAYIKNKDFNEYIRIYYEPNDFDVYCLVFATQHIHISEKDDLLKYAFSFANAEIAAIEFYENGKNRFGGDIKTELLNDMTYDSLRILFGYQNTNMSHLTFKVTAWNMQYNFVGKFAKDDFGNTIIIKEFDQN